MFFDNVYMGGATFVNACLAKARFWNADLSRASFRGASFGATESCRIGQDKAHFYQATLVGTDFSGVDIEGVSFGRAHLCDADFSEAIHVEKANFEEACGRAKFPAFPPCPEPCPPE
jgi:uncharacterized protein YjbI with pentapeptide repeats